MLTMVFKLDLEAQKIWKRLKGYRLIPLGRFCGTPLLTGKRTRVDPDVINTQ